MVLGITGISGSGKHTAAKFLEQRGWKVLDADKIAHSLYRPYTHVWKGISTRFGEKILNQDDTINRQKLGAIVFDTDHPEEANKALQDLNNLVHPELHRRLKEEVRYLHKKGGHVILVGALWEEIKMREMVSFMLLLKAPLEISVERIQKRDGLSETMVIQRIQAQKNPPNPDKIIENKRDLQMFYKSLVELEHELI